MKSALAYVLGVIYLIDIFWFVASLKYGQYASAAVTAVIAIVPAVWLVLSIRKDEHDLRTEKRKLQERLMKKGRCIEVNLSECTISEAAHTVRYTRSDLRANRLATRLHRPNSLNEHPVIPKMRFNSQLSNALDEQIFPDLAEQEHSYEHCVCQITCRVAVNGKRRQTFRSPAILMDKASLGVKLALKGTGELYINPSNPKEYCFDLEFLRDESGWSPVEN